MLADKSSLVIRVGLHPAIQHVLLDAAEQIHARPGVFSEAGQYPAPEAIDLALSAEARHYYESGRPFLQRHLPFWAAVVRRRVFKLYTELRAMERELRAIGSGTPSRDFLERLDRLDPRAHGMRVPMSFMPMLYTLRHHITLVRAQLQDA
jgi:hypothetical protein